MSDQPDTKAPPNRTATQEGVRVGHDAPSMITTMERGSDDSSESTLPTKTVADEEPPFRRTSTSEPDADDDHDDADDRAHGPALAAGTMVRQYEIIRPIGRGGMGQIFLARDTRLGRLVALKFLRTVDSRRTERFMTEARATAQLTHENVVVIHEVGVHERGPFMALEYVKGQTLHEWLAARRKSAAGGTGVSPGRAAALMVPVVRALMRAHESGIVHRDLKPGNIMLTDTGTVKVLDFGLAKMLSQTVPDTDSGEMCATEVEAVPASASHTRPGALVGTIPYMAPEQWGVDTVDHRVDLWAVGIILHELVTGEHPLVPLSRAALATVPVLEIPMPVTRTRYPELGKLAAIIDRCLVKPKADRIGSAHALLAELEMVARPGLAAAAGDSRDDNPYPGLAAFQERDAARFYGRERAVQQALARLEEQPIVAVLGPSGAGKSSFVRAGVIPALKRGGDAWDAFSLRPGARPVAALAELLLQRAWDMSSGDSDTTAPRAASHGDGGRDAVCEQLRDAPGLLGGQLRARARRKRTRVLLFVDQLEELFTLAPAGERDAFLDCLTGAADDTGSAVRIIVSMRADFLDRMAENHAAMADLGRGMLLFAPMDRAAMREALVRPLEALEYRFEDPALVEEMLDALAHTRGALPLLQFTAARLWECRDRARRVLTTASYRELGGVAGTLASHADAVLGTMSAAETRLVRAALLRLVTPERTRALATTTELRALASAPDAHQAGAGSGDMSNIMDRVLARLIDARLLTVETGAGAGDLGHGTVELVHESLIERWPLLAEWLRENEADEAFLARLRAAARVWDRDGRPDDLVWRGRAAEEARHWYSAHRADPDSALSAHEEAYLAAVVRLAARARRQRRLAVSTLIAALAAVALVVSYLAIRARDEAAQARAQAAERAREAMLSRNATILAVAETQRVDPTRVLALLRAIEPGDPPPGWATLARWALDAGVAHTMRWHPVAVESVAVGPRARHIATACDTGEVYVWNADGTGEPRILSGHEGWVHALAFSPDERLLASAGHDLTVRVWSVDGTGAPQVLRGHSGDLLSVAFSPDGARIASGADDGTVHVWNADGTGAPRVLRSHESPIQTVAFSPDGTRIAAGASDGSVQVWSTNGTGAPLILRGHSGQVLGVAFSPDGARIVSVAADHTVRTWNADGTGARELLRGPKAEIVSAALGPDGRHVAFATVDETVQLWRLDGAGPFRILRGHDGDVPDVAFSPDGARIVSVSQDRTMRVWSTAAPDATIVLRGHDGDVPDVAFSPDGSRLAAVTSEGGAVWVWNADGTGTPLILRGPGSPMEAVAYSPDGTRIAGATDVGEVWIWNAGDAGAPRILRGPETALWGVVFSPDGTRIAAAEDKKVWVWNADGTGVPLVLRGHEGIVLNVAFSPDGRRIASSGQEGTVRLWNATGTGVPLVLRGHEGLVFDVVFSPDGTRIATASSDGTVRVWNADGTGVPLVLRGHSDDVLTVAFSPDGTRIASGASDATVRVWNADGTGVPLVLRGHDREVGRVVFSPDGTRIASSSNDWTVRVWHQLMPIEPTDPRLWTATTECLSVELRQALLAMPAELSRQAHEDCLRRSAAARDGGTQRARPPATPATAQ